MLEGWGVPGGQMTEGENWENCNYIIYKIYLKIPLEFIWEIKFICNSILIERVIYLYVSQKHTWDIRKTQAHQNDTTLQTSRIAN